MAKRSRKPRYKRAFVSKNLWPYHGLYRKTGNWSGITPVTINTSVSRTGTENPFWTRQVAEGVDAGSAYTRIQRNKVVQSESVNWRWTQWRNSRRENFFTYELSGDFPLAYTASRGQMDPTFDVSRLKSEAKIAFLGKLREAQTSFQGLTFLGELKETIGMVKSPLKGIRDITKRYNNGVRRINRLQKAGRLAGSVADAYASLYLQWTYGVSPLINDVKGICDAVKEMVENPPLKDIPIRVTVKDGYISWLPMLVGPTSTVPVYCTGFDAHKISVQIKGAVKAEASSSSSESARWGFELREFVPTIWELVPYSFLVDYFTNVGNVLGAAFTASQSLRWYWQTVRVRSTRTSLCVPGPTTGLSRTHPWTPAVAKIENLSITRDKPSLSVSLTDFHFQHPTVGQWINTTVLGFAALRR